MRPRDADRRPLELWGGVECTLVRVGDDLRDQAVETGHAHRLADLDAIAALGVTTVRYPVQWERIAPDGPTRLDWAWTDERLKRLRDLGIRVAAGLVHHGSGPSYTGLTDPDFGRKLGEFAARVAERYPWIELWNPVNEPFTTARFACLYGLWQPHLHSMDAALRALVYQCEGIAAAIAAARAVNPGALLMVTEDLGKTFSTERLDYQAEHENERRWLTFDLLAGRVDRDHGFRGWLEKAGIAPERLDALATGEARPDILGIDHYLTSERFLDHRVERYPHLTPGSNRRHTYVDVEAVRVAALANKVGPALRLQEAWDRYGIPLVVGEVHHGCTREEQLRWVDQVWRAAEEVRANGGDVRAVTLWALFGLMDWRSLMTRREGAYESGVFDTRGKVPRPTLVAKSAAALAAGRPLEHPVLDGAPWWKRSERLYVGARASHDIVLGRRPLLLTGATGTLGQAFARLCHHRGLAHAVTDRSALDITDSASIAAALDRVRPWAVVNTAGFVRVADAEQEAADCFRINATGPELLATACAARGIPFVTFSSDLVFDGQLGRSYLEPDATAPQGVYGHSKATAEERVLAIHDGALVVRTSAFFGPWDRFNFLFSTLHSLSRGKQVAASDRTIVSPTYVPDLVHATLDLLLDGERGIWHLANQGSVSWHGLAHDIAGRARLDTRRVIESNGLASDTSLATGRGQILRPLGEALTDFMLHAEALPHR